MKQVYRIIVITLYVEVICSAGVYLTGFTVDRVELRGLQTLIKERPAKKKEGLSILLEGLEEGGFLL